MIPTRNKTYVLIACISFCIIYSLVTAFIQPEWELKLEKENIKVYTRLIEGNPIKEVKSATQIKATPECLISIIKNIPGYSSWVYKCKKAEIIQTINENEFIYYQLTDAPWPIKSRDMVIRLKISQETGKSITVISEAVAGIVPEKKGIVRIKKFNSTWVINQAEGITEVSNELALNPGGGISAKLVNKLIIDGPYNTMLNFRKLALASCK